MNFLKISGLVIGTGSVVGGTGAGIYYGVIKNNDAESNGKVNFVGKLVFEKKSANPDNYEIKFFTTDEYNTAVTSFDANKSTENEKYIAVNKILDISYLLNPETTKNELTNIFTSETTLSGAKTKITSEATKLKELLGAAIYAKLQAIN